MKANALNRGMLGRFSDPVAAKILELATKWGAEYFILSSCNKDVIHISEVEDGASVIKLDGSELIVEDFWVEGDTIPLETGMAIVCFEARENAKAEIITTIVITFVSVHWRPGMDKHTFRGNPIRWEGDGVYGWDKEHNAWCHFKYIEGLESYIRLTGLMPEYIHQADLS